ncbi:type II toxin-antitoxin system VapC family toxin [Ursidibacter arcticus]
MKVLLDTHILLWLAFDNKSKLSPQSIDLLEDFNNELYFSLASLWEIAIKSSLGKPDFEVNVEQLEKGLLSVGCKSLSIQLPHIVKSAQLPMIHKDPFDRLLLAQAEYEGIYFLTADSLIVQYQKAFILKA